MVCPKFILDIQAEEFGICKNCGCKQSEHKTLKGKALWKTKTKVTGKQNTEQKKPQKAKSVCDMFAVDLFATEFGTCKTCGHSQAYVIFLSFPYV